MGLYGNEKKHGKKHAIDADNTTGSYHSGFYHRYYEGYTEVTRLNEKGNPYIERIYTGVYHECQLTPWSRAMVKLAYVLLIIGAFYLFELGAASETSKILAILNCLAIITFITCLYALGHYLLAPAKTRLYEFRTSSEFLCETTKILALIIGVYTVGELLFILYRGQLLAEGARILPELVLAVVLCLGIPFLEHQIPYKEVKNPLAETIDGIEI